MLSASRADGERRSGVQTGSHTTWTSTLSTPSSSHLLGRVSSQRYLPLVFSIKQTAVPAGLLLAGVLGPPLTEWKDWRFTMLLSAAACAVFVLMLQPLRRNFDDDRVPTRTSEGSTREGSSARASEDSELMVPAPSTETRRPAASR